MSDIDPWEGDDDDPPIMESKVALHGDLYGKVKGICKMRGMTISEYMTRILCAVLGLHHADYAVRSTHTVDLPERVERRLEELEAFKEEHAEDGSLEDLHAMLTGLILHELPDTKRKTLTACRHRPRTAKEIADLLDIADSYASTVLKDLHEAGVLDRRHRTAEEQNPYEYVWPTQEDG